jgi:hypothetical protein
MGGYWFNVRDVAEPHKILGELNVPREAATGKIPVVCFEVGAPRNGLITTMVVNVDLFIVNGRREFAIKMTPTQFENLARQMKGSPA